jgi:hypothetical protein
MRAAWTRRNGRRSWKTVPSLIPDGAPWRRAGLAAPLGRAGGFYRRIAMEG